MQVLGDLVRLPKDGWTLPLPWWQRAPLGFLNRTNLYVGLLHGQRRPVGDIVVSVLDIHKWNNILRLECSHDDERGVIASLMEAVLPLNIALAETVTTETGKEHRATLFCEDKGIQRVEDAMRRIHEILKQRGFRDVHLSPYLSPTRLPILEGCEAEIDHGWLRNIPFREWLGAHHEESQRRLMDLTQAVVSADTEMRILRFVFPYKGAKTIRVSHTDKPGALHVLFSAFAACHLNVLSSLLRRGGQKAGYSVLIAVCEPNPRTNPVDVYDQLRRRIANADPRFDVTVSIDDGKPAEDVVAPPSLRQQTPDGAKPIFFTSHHAVDDERSRKLDEHVRQTLRSQGGWVLEKGNDDKDPDVTLRRAHALMDRAHGSVILVTGSSPHTAPNARFDLLHDLGYLHALYKPVLLLTDDDNGTLERWLRAGPGMSRVIAPGDHAFLPDHPASIHRLATIWLNRLRQQVRA